MKRSLKITIISIVVIAITLCFATPIFGAPGDWNLDGTWVIEFTKVPSGDTFIHDMVVSGGTATGSSTGNTYDATVSVTGNSVTIVATYRLGSVAYPYTYTADGTISGSGTLSGTWFDDRGNSGTWISTSGAATLIEDTKAGILKGSGVLGKGIDTAPGLQKPFNPKSQAGENAGKK